MKSILTKILILILLFAVINIPSSVYAMDNVIQDAEGFLGSRNETSPIDEDALEDTSDYVYNILFTIAVVLAVAIGMIIGIQFITGSVEEQAKVKETLVPYVIGVFIVFASFTIWKIVVEIGDDVSPTPAATGGSLTDPDGDGYVTPPATGILCTYCGKDMGSVPAGVITGGRTYPCPHCGKQVQF